MSLGSGEGACGRFDARVGGSDGGTRRLGGRARLGEGDRCLGEGLLDLREVGSSVLADLRDRLAAHGAGIADLQPGAEVRCGVLSASAVEGVPCLRCGVLGAVACGGGLRRFLRACVVVARRARHRIGGAREVGVRALEFLLDIP